MQLLEPLDPEVADLAKAYRFCKLFHCSMDEYESRPYGETTWLLKIDDTYNEAVKEMQDNR